MKKYSACILMLCMIINFLIPRFSVGQGAFDKLSVLIKNQSTLVYFFSLSSLPMKLVSELLATEIAESAKGKSRPQKNTSPASNTSADYSLLSANAASNLKNVFEKAFAFPVPAFVLPQARIDVLSRYCIGARGPGLTVLIVLMFFFLRPRSAIDDLIVFFYTNNKTRFLSTGFFLFIERFNSLMPAANEQKKWSFCEY